MAEKEQTSLKRNQLNEKKQRKLTRSTEVTSVIQNPVKPLLSPSNALSTASFNVNKSINYAHPQSGGNASHLIQAIPGNTVTPSSSPSSSTFNQMVTSRSHHTLSMKNSINDDDDRKYFEFIKNSPTIQYIDGDYENIESTKFNDSSIFLRTVDNDNDHQHPQKQHQSSSTIHQYQHQQQHQHQQQQQQHQQRQYTTTVAVTKQPAVSSSPQSPSTVPMAIRTDDNEYRYDTKINSPNEQWAKGSSLSSIVSHSYGMNLVTATPNTHQQQPSPPPVPARTFSTKPYQFQESKKSFNRNTQRSLPHHSASAYLSSNLNVNTSQCGGIGISSQQQQQHAKNEYLYNENNKYPFTIPSCCLKRTNGTVQSPNRNQPLTPTEPIECGGPNTVHAFSNDKPRINQMMTTNTRRQHLCPVTTSTVLSQSLPNDHLLGTEPSLTNLNPFTFGNPDDGSKILTPKGFDHMSSSINQCNSTNPFISDNMKHRDEFVKATMKICLVVSPPTNKFFQLKSKSLTHLDNLESNIDSLADKSKQNSDYYESLRQQHQQQSIKHEMEHKASCRSSSSSIHSVPSTTKLTSLKPSKSILSLSRKHRNVQNDQSTTNSDYFYLSFDMENEAGIREEMIPVIKGKTLSEILGESLRQRNLTFTQIRIIENNNSNSSTELSTPPSTASNSLDENTDVGYLGGKYLIVTDKDVSKRSSLIKASSFGSRTRPPKLFQSASTEENSIDPQSDQQRQINKNPKQRLSGLFGLKNPQKNQLCDILNHYAKNGVPQTATATQLQPEYNDTFEFLESMKFNSWTEFVDCTTMSDIEVKIQSAVWELVTTEIDYIHTLQTVTELFLACLEAIQSENILIEVDKNKLFSNIRDIYDANIKFFTSYIYPMVQHSINEKHPLCIDYIRTGFLSFANMFAPYTVYCAEQSTCQFYCKELNTTNPLFTSYLAWCEGQKLCNRLRLADILVRPMQRLTKYSLLLTAIRKHMVDERDLESMEYMIHSVEKFVQSVNLHLTARQETERLKGIMARIESYDVVDTNNEQLEKLSKHYSKMFDLCEPMKGCHTDEVRRLFMEGDLKLKDCTSKVDVHCFLLTDILLICKTITKKGQGALKVIRQPYFTDRIVTKLRDNTIYCVYLNEFGVVTNVFTLQCLEAKSWFDTLTKVKQCYIRIKQGVQWDAIRYGFTNESLGVRRSPLASSIGSRVSSLSNSHSGSVELNESKNVSIDCEKTNSLSSDDGMSIHSATQLKRSGGSGSGPTGGLMKLFGGRTSPNTLTVKPITSLGQSLPNLNFNPVQTSSSHHNTLLVPGTSSHSNNQNLLSPCHRGISYPPPSPTRGMLKRGFAFSSSIKNPPLVKTRNISSLNSFCWPQLATTGQNQTTATSSSSSVIGTQTTATTTVAMSGQNQQTQQTTGRNESDV